MPDSASPSFIASYSTNSFPEGTIKRFGSLEFTVDELAHALFVTGRAPGNRLSYGAASV
jgi:hypothetical protein